MSDSGIASSKDKQQGEELVMIDIKETLEPRPGCCIYRVPKKLRKVNEDAYTPQLISIGPFHHGTKELAEMQKQKKRYQEHFHNRVGEKKIEELRNFIIENEQSICDCYAGQIICVCDAEELENLSDHFREMILYDAVFIIELFLRNYWNDTSDFLLNKPWLKKAIKLDLQLLENQLPYMLLKKLYELAFGGLYPSFIDLSFKFFKHELPERVEKSNQRSFKHFVDLRRYVMLAGIPIPPNDELPKGKFEDIPSAVKLDESGVKFKATENKCLLDVKIGKRKILGVPCFRGDELQIPKITIKDCTECLFRNLMAFEQCHYASETHVCNYIDLMDHLINTSKDVDLLVDKGIISNRVGDHKSIKEIFNKLCLQIRLSRSCYKETSKKLKEHHGKWWNRTKATLISVYFSNLWRGTGTIAAAILLTLTILQTLQRFFPEWFQH